tara:strand:+ start:1068 stop:1331 length:264 start_codon:yes stop_codon:yes gene_type:complete
MSKNEQAEQSAPKKWKRAGIHNTYEEALNQKIALTIEHTVDSDLLIKIKRCGPMGTKYQVKYWHPEFLAPNKNKKKTKKMVDNKPQK